MASTITMDFSKEFNEDKIVYSYIFQEVMFGNNYGNKTSGLEILSKYGYNDLDELSERALQVVDAYTKKKHKIFKDDTPPIDIIQRWNFKTPLKVIKKSGILLAFEIEAKWYESRRRFDRLVIGLVQSEPNGEFELSYINKELDITDMPPPDYDSLVF